MEDHRYAMDIIAAFAERTIKRLWILCIVEAVIIALLIGGFLLYESQFETLTGDLSNESYEAYVDGAGAIDTVFNQTVGGVVNEGNDELP